MPFLLEEFHGESISSVVATGETEMDVIVATLGRLTTQEIHELQAVYLPRAREVAVNSEARTPRVRLNEPSTVAVPVEEIRRSTRDAAAAVMDDDGAPD